MQLFCETCKSIIVRKRTPGGIVEFCHCPDKLEKNYIIPEPPVAPKTRSQNKNHQASVVTFQKGRSVESITVIKPQRPPSEYASLNLNLRLLKVKPRLLASWNRGQVGLMLQQKLNATYERFYRKFEDFFLNKHSELQFLVLFVPTENMTEFEVVYWGVGAIEHIASTNSWELIRWYQGNNLPFDWSAKIRENEGSYLAPYRLFSVQHQTSAMKNINYLSQKSWFNNMQQQWIAFKKLYPNRIFRTPTHKKLYTLWSETLLVL